MQDATYNPDSYEKKWWDFWQQQKLFEADSNSAKEPYVILMPPPNVTDRLHMGHGLNNTIQDIYIRWQRMLGKEVCWLPGTDHAGIATQMMVEKSLASEGTTRQALGREEFIKRCWQWKEKHGGIIVEQLKRLGASADWRREAFTMSPQLSSAVRQMFVDLYNKGLIYRGQRLVNWDFELKTAISDDEVVNVEETGKLWSFAYPLVDGSGELVIATTRPETMFGDVAVAVHPDDQRYRQYIGQQVRLPLTDRNLPIIADNYVKQQFGTGCVKITPAHDFNDFAIGKRHGLPTRTVFDDDGKLNNYAPSEFIGLDRPEARKLAIRRLNDEGLMRGEQKHRHTLPYSDRSKTIIEPRLSKQWFLRMQPLVPEAIRVVTDNKLKFYPASWEKTYLHWLENIEDWCISRQLWWGHRLPIWHCQQCGKHCATPTVDPDCCPYCQSTNLVQDEDVLDTWFSSWLWPFSTLNWPEAVEGKFYPSNVLITGADIIFLWVARMVIAGLEVMGQLPFKDVYFNSIICDRQGRKFSKTLGNGIDPFAVIDKHGADAVRYTCVSLAPLGGRARMAVDDFVHGGRFINKIWNAARFLFAHLEKQPLLSLSNYQLTVPEKWLVNELRQTVADIDQQLANYRLDTMANRLYHFIWGTYCDWGVEIAKRFLRQGEKKNILSTMCYLLEGLLRLAHPVIPFVSEELWQKLPAHPDWDRPVSLAVASFPQTNNLLSYDPNELQGWLLTKELITATRTIRSQAQIPPRTAIDIDLVVEQQIYQDWLSDFAMVNNINYLAIDDQRPKQTLVAVGKGYEVYARVGDYLDLAKEEQRLRKEQQRLQGLLNKLDNKLNNPDFVKRAPAEIVEGQRQQQLTLQKQLATIDINLRSLL